jgi:hypothetical protein
VCVCVCIHTWGALTDGAHLLLPNPPPTPANSLLKLAQALLKVDEKPQSLWLVTRGAYVGDIQPNQGVLQGFATVLKSELKAVVS